MKTTSAPGFGCVLQAHGAGERAGDLAISYPGEALTWAELDARTAARARRLIDLGVAPDDLVVVALPNGVEHRG